MLLSQQAGFALLPAIGRWGHIGAADAIIRYATSPRNPIYVPLESKIKYTGHPLHQEFSSALCRRLYISNQLLNCVTFLGCLSWGDGGGTEVRNKLFCKESFERWPLRCSIQCERVPNKHSIGAFGLKIKEKPLYTQLTVVYLDLKTIQIILQLHWKPWVLSISKNHIQPPQINGPLNALNLAQSSGRSWRIILKGR